MALQDYHLKRDFERTPEPQGGPPHAPDTQDLAFVIQRHAARRLHWDFRLELDGVLKSWAVPRPPSLDPGVKRLAIAVEDHPLDYAGFEGEIPPGQYGAGTVAIWDRGQWRPEGDPREGLAQGKLAFVLKGRRLRGGWALVRLRDQPSHWLLVKEDDDQARRGDGAVDPADLPGARPGPPPEGLSPQLASPVAEAPAGEQWLHEIKYDGYRMLCRVAEGRARLVSRNGKDWTGSMAPLAEAAARLPVSTALLDGEVVVLGAGGASDFQALQEALADNRAGALVYQLFDLLHVDGVDLTGVELERRKRVLRGLLPGDGPLRYSDHVDGQGPEVWRKACGFALEGVVSKRRDRPYRPGRGPDWLKAKCVSRQEFVIGGFTRPAGRRQGMGALLLGVWGEAGLLHAGRVGTGFSQRQLEDLAARLARLARATPPFVNPPAGHEGVTWVEPSLVAEVAFAAWTRDGLLRHPAYLGLRLDKPAAEVTREVAPTPTPIPDEAMPTLTSPDKVLFPEAGLTKAGLADYYRRVAGWMLPHVAGRPLTVVRCPDGLGRECFHQRHPRAGMPAVGTYVAIGDLAGLQGLVQVGALEIHPWGSRLDRIERPDRLVFDLDPDPSLPWRLVVEAAREVRRRLDALGLASFVKTTGGKGLHVVVPLRRRHSWTEAKAFTKAVAERMAAEQPARYTATMALARREGRIYVDYLRNQRAATAVAPYSTRAHPDAPVAVPLAWEELDAGLHAFTVCTLPGRLAALRRDPWADMAATRQGITAAARRAVGLPPET